MSAGSNPTRGVNLPIGLTARRLGPSIAAHPRHRDHTTTGDTWRNQRHALDRLHLVTLTTP